MRIDILYLNHHILRLFLPTGDFSETGTSAGQMRTSWRTVNSRLSGKFLFSRLTSDD